MIRDLCALFSMMAFILTVSVWAPLLAALIH